MATRSTRKPKSKPTPKRVASRPVDPTRIEPAEFFEDFLPARHAEAVERFGAPAGVDLSARVELTGAGGGVWEIVFEGAELSVAERASDRAVDVHVFQSVDDWKTLLRGELGGPAAAIPAAAAHPVPIVPLDPAAHERLRKLRGTLVFEVRHFQDRNWRLGFHFGPGDVREPPDTLFSMGALDFQSLAGDGRPPTLQSLMLGGALRIEGNFALAGELAAIAAAQTQAILGART